VSEEYYSNPLRPLAISEIILLIAIGVPEGLNAKIVHLQRIFRTLLLIGFVATSRMVPDLVRPPCAIR
jgi:hypothetical protein